MLPTRTLRSTLLSLASILLWGTVAWGGNPVFEDPPSSAAWSRGPSLLRGELPGFAPLSVYREEGRFPMSLTVCSPTEGLDTGTFGVNLGTLRFQSDRASAPRAPQRRWSLSGLETFLGAGILFAMPDDDEFASSAAPSFGPGAWIGARTGLSFGGATKGALEFRWIPAQAGFLGDMEGLDFSSTSVTLELTW